MDSVLSNENRLAGVHRLLPAFTPVLLVSIGYIDPGKWAVTVEGAVRFGFDMVAFVLVFNCTAVLCQTLSAHISVVTEKNLAEIYKDEYDQGLWFLLGIQAEVSTIALDITMVLGIAHGLNLLLGLDLFSCFFLTALDAVLYPFSAKFLESSKDKLQWLRIGCVILFACAFGVLFSQTEISASLNGLPTTLSGEGVYVLMSLLGASILPQNIYLHSVLVQKQTETNMRKSSLFNDHLFATICVFSGIYLANYILAISVVNASINDPGLVLLTFQDAMLLIEQLFRSPIAALGYLLVLIGTSQMTSLIWNIGGEPVLHNFLRLDIPSWVHRAGIRMVSILSATYFLRNSGAEGLYQLLIFMQVIVSLLLPPSLVPLFRVATSRPLMGVHRISHFVEYVALITLISMFGMKIFFLVEMIFGSSDWAGNFWWNIGTSSSSLFVILLTTTCASLCLMLWLVTTPLKSASSSINSQDSNRATPVTTPGYNREKERYNLDEFGTAGEEKIEKLDASPESGKFSRKHSVTSMITYASDTPEVESQPKRHLTTIEDKQSTVTFQGSQLGTYEEELAGAQSVLESTCTSKSANNISLEVNVNKINSIEAVEKTIEAESDGHPKKGSGAISLDSEEMPKTVSGATTVAPGSFRSPSGKGDDTGNATGSLSRLAGLGRAARRQLAATLDEFWGQLFDFHGKVTQEAKNKKLSIVIGIESKNVSSPQKVEASGLDTSSYFPHHVGAGSDSSVGSGLFETLEHQRVQTAPDSPFRTPSGSLSSQHLRLLRACEQVSSGVFPDAGERRYSSLRLPPTSEGFDNRPATGRGYQIASYLNQIGIERNSNFNRQRESPMQKSQSLGPLSYKDANAFSLGQKLQNGPSLTLPSLQNVSASRNDLMKPEISYYEPFSLSPSTSMISPINEKKYCSLPDISGASIFQRNMINSDRNTQWDSGIRYGQSLNKPSYEPSVYPSTGSIGGSLAYDDFSLSENYKNALSMHSISNVDSTSLWTKQPFEQFGLADRSWTTRGNFESKPKMVAIPAEIPDVVDPEVILLQSLRQCILKLLKLEGSDWLFQLNTGMDEELIDRVAAREKLLMEAENREMTLTHVIDAQYSSPDRKSIALVKPNETGFGVLSVPTVPHCGDDCIWKAELIVSFGVWCIRRILDLSLMESRPELWGKYTYVLNRLQGVIDPAFSKPRSPAVSCFCLQISGVNILPTTSPSLGSGGALPPTAKLTNGKCTTAARLLDTIKDVEVAISGRKGRTGTAAGDVAFPKGKENIASVLKRYKLRLSKLPSSHEATSNLRKGQPTGSYAS